MLCHVQGQPPPVFWPESHSISYKAICRWLILVLRLEVPRKGQAVNHGRLLLVPGLGQLSENLNSIKQFQSEMKDTLTEMKNNLQGINSRMDEAKNQISDLEYEKAKTPN